MQAQQSFPAAARAQARCPRPLRRAAAPWAFRCNELLKRGPSLTGALLALLPLRRAGLQTHEEIHAGWKCYSF